jgi:hypothetical protein
VTRRAPIVALALVAALPLAALPAQQAPVSRCVLQFEPLRATPPRTTLNKLPSEKYNVFQGGGVRYRCEGQAVTLEADSAEFYGDRDVLYLIGSVHYTEPRVTVNSRRMSYFRLEERLVAEGDVDAVLPTGTSMRGPVAEYYKQTPSRPRTRMVATGRPRISLAQRDSSGRAAEPVLLVAERVVLDGDSLVYASGRVEITRTDVQATGDSAFLDSGREYARLMRSPTIEGKPSRSTDKPYRLSGSVIDLYSRQRVLQRVVSLGKARAVSDEQGMTLTSDTIDLRVVQNRLERAFAWGPGRAHVVSPGNDILSDSLDVLMPGQRIREVRAVRKAFAQTQPDTTKIRTSEKDWLRGDTIVARFDTLVATDTSSRPHVREVVATGTASSYYHIAAQNGDPTRPAINYVRGGAITVALRNQAVQTVTVTDSAAGVYLEPAAADSAAARTPSATTQPGQSRATPATRTGASPARRSNQVRP